MNDRFEQIDECLKMWYRQRNRHDIYDQLVHYQLPQQELQYDVSPLFPKWQTFLENSFSSVYNTGVINDFFVCDNMVIDGKEVKLYVPLSKDNIERGVELLISYLKDKKIPYNLKVATQIRVDGITIRVGQMAHARKIISGIQNMPMLKSGLLKPNPFLVQIKQIGLAVDGYLSYNRVLAHFIDKFLSLQPSSNTVSHKHLLLFLEQVYYNTFVLGTNYPYFLKEMKQIQVSPLATNQSNAQIMANHMQVFELIQLAVNPKKDDNDFDDHIIAIKKPEHIEKQVLVMQSIEQKWNRWLQGQINEVELNAFKIIIIECFRLHGFDYTTDFIKQIAHGNYEALKNLPSHFKTIINQYLPHALVRTYLLTTFHDSSIEKAIHSFCQTAISADKTEFTATQNRI